MKRRWNAARLDGYVAALAPADGNAPRLPPGGTAPQLGPEDLAAEVTLLGLRTRAGGSAGALDSPRLEPALAWGLDAGLLERGPGETIVLTLSGRLLSNEVFARLV